MHPELFEIPFVHVTVKSYGVLMVTGFLLAVWLMRGMMKRAGQNPEHISNIAMYTLILGIIGARIFFVLHYFDQFRGRPLEVFALWQGGLEFLGGFITAISFMWYYLWRRKLPVQLYLDVLAVGLMVGLGVGRLGCLMFGCCYGKCSDNALAIQFPYGSPAFHNQISPDPDRGRAEPLLNLPSNYFDGEGYLQSFDSLTLEQQKTVTEGNYQTLKVLPTQLFSSANALMLAGVLYLIWRKVGLIRPGMVLGFMFIFYGITRFYLETLRDDNPFEKAWWAIYKGGTVSQNISIYMLVIGIILFVVFISRKSPQQPESRAQE